MNLCVSHITLFLRGANLWLVMYSNKVTADVTTVIYHFIKCIAPIFDVLRVAMCLSVRSISLFAIPCVGTTPLTMQIYSAAMFPCCFLHAQNSHYNQDGDNGHQYDNGISSIPVKQHVQHHRSNAMYTV